MYARPQKRKNYSEIAKQAASAAAAGTKKKSWIPDAVSSKGQETSSSGEESTNKDTVASGLVASLSLTFGASSSQNLSHPFLRPKKRQADKRPFSSMAVCSSEVKANAERRSLVGGWSPSSFGSKRMSQLPTPISGDSKSVSSVSSLRTLPQNSTEGSAEVADNVSSSKTATITNGTATTTATSSITTPSQQVKGSQEKPNQPDTSPSKSPSSKKAEKSFSYSPSPSPSPQTPLSAPTSPYLKMESVTRSRMDSAQCREIWTLPSSRANSEKQLFGLGEETIVTMAQLVDEHWRKFPVAVKVLTGLVDEKLFTNSILDLHFLKRTKVLDISDSLSQRFLIPHNSPIKFGVIYCPGVKNENYFFDRALDIIQAPDIPKVVTCTKKVKNKDEKSSVNFNEVLIVLEVVKGSKLPKKPKLKVYSVTEKRLKTLPGDTAGNFTTDPRKAQFYIPEILEHIPNVFPLSARLFLEGEHDLPDHLTKSPVTLLSSTIEESFIGALKDEVSHDSGVNKKNISNLVELPIVSDVQVSIISEDQIQLSTIEVMYADTQTIWRNLVGPPDQITACSHPAVCGRTPLQNKLTLLCRKGDEAKYCTLEAPPLVKRDLAAIEVSCEANAYQVLLDGAAPVSLYTKPKRTLSSSNSSLDTTRSNSTTDESIGGNMDQELDSFEKIMKSKRDMIKQEPADGHSMNMRLIRRVEAVEARVANAAPQTLVNRLTRRVEAIESQPKQKDKKLSQDVSKADRAEIEALKKTVESMQVTIRSLVEELQQVKSKQAELISEANKKEVAAPEYEEMDNDLQHNISILRSMDASQILKLLDRVGLSKYKDVFIEESINGDILAECTESVLMEDLDIKNPSHCSKLMDIIHGKSISVHLLESIKQSSR